MAMINIGKKGFTLVELIVVITIIGILSTVGFVAYTDYLKGVRDSSRLQQISGIYKASTLFATRSMLPTPIESIDVVAGGNKIGIQGYADQSVLETIQYMDGGFDPKSKEFYTYFVSHDRKYSQVLGFFEEPRAKELFGFKRAYVQNEAVYSSLYPLVIGDELGTLLEAGTKIPIQKFEKDIDILTATGAMISYINNSNIIKGFGREFIGMVPNITCKKILNSLGSAKNGLYRINIDGDQQIEVYCDMETDGGGWTFVGHIDNDTNGTETYFNTNFGVYDTSFTDTGKSFMLDTKRFFHNEMLILFDEFDILKANMNNRLLQLKYDIHFEPFTRGPLVPCSGNLLGDSTGFFYRFGLIDEYSFSTSYGCNSFVWQLLTSNRRQMLSFRDFISGDGNGTGARYDSALWGIVSGDPNYDVSWGHDVWIYVR